MARMENRKQRGPVWSILAAAVVAFVGGLLAHDSLVAAPADASVDVTHAGARHILVVLSNAFEGADDVFNEWYTGTHLPDVIKVDGFSGAQRFKLSSAQMDDGGGEPYAYLAIYAVEAEDVSVPRDALRRSADDPEAMYVDPSLDRDRTVAWFYTPITGVLER